MKNSESNETSKPLGASQVDQNRDQPISSRRLKKREVDRRCQREARERRKSRIADLEQLVESMRQQDASGQVTALLMQLKSVEAERDMAMKTLKDIQQIMFLRPLKSSEAPAHNTSFPHRQLSPGGASNTSGLIESPAGTLAPEMAYPQNRLRDTTAPANDVMGTGIATPPSKSTLDFSDIPSSLSVVESKSPISMYQLPSHTMNTVRYHAAGSTSEAYRWVSAKQTCCCHDHVMRQQGQYAVWQGNFWKFIRDVLDEHFDWDEAVQPADDAESEDIPIRVMLEGWDAVARRGPLHPSWHMLRRIDEATFGPIPKLERLAMLRAMHLLIQYHTDPRQQRYKRLPPWYIYRPSQHIRHDYAMDYYAWPPFRQQFIHNQHAYCGNDFFRLYQYQLRLLWPYEFRQCYTHDSETGLYRPSLLFDQIVNDIKCWTMGNDFFERFPELSSAIPSSGLTIQRLLTPSTTSIERQSRASRASYRTTLPTSGTALNRAQKRPRETEYVEGEDEQPEADSGVSRAPFTAYHDSLSSISSSLHFKQYPGFLPPKQGYISQQPAADGPFHLFDASPDSWVFDPDLYASTSDMNNFPFNAMGEDDMYFCSDPHWVQPQTDGGRVRSMSESDNSATIAVQCV